MRFSVWPDPGSAFEHTAAIVTACEAYGWHAAYVADHFMPNAPDATPLRGDTLEATTTLAALAARTSRIRLGTLVASATYRHPAVFANAMATLDRISGGRVICGMGAGWQANEHAAYGIELGSITERIDRFEEYVAIVASMLHEEATTFTGDYFSVTDAPCDPRPVQPQLPILLGVRGARRTMRIAAQHAGIWNSWCTPAELAECNRVLDGHCETIGRDPATIARTTQALVFLSRDEAWLATHRSTDPSRQVVVGTPDEVREAMAAYEAAGCDEFIVPCFTFGSLDRSLETLALFDAEVASSFA